MIKVIVLGRFAINEMYFHPRRAIALRDYNKHSLEISASGGAFAVFARAILQNGGAVFGAALHADATVRHICVRSIDDLHLLQGSKYVWSDCRSTFDKCAQLLNKGIEVLYSGTPCQIYALRHYVHKLVSHHLIDRNLICVDLICHGTPDGELFRAYLQWLASKHHADDGIHGFEFRSKKMGWGTYYYYYFCHGRKKEKLGPARDDPYYSAFVKGITYRKGCYKCPFARLERVGDLTIGDYWGIEQVHPKFYDKQGVSAVLINTAKGEGFFSRRCEEKCEWLESDPKVIALYNTSLTMPTERSADSVRLAREVEVAIREGDYERVFGQLLSPRLSVAAKIRQALPWRLVRLLTSIR